MVVETTIALILIFGTLVLFHELGHFLAAKLSGIRVEEFGFGWGPRLVTLFRRSGTEYTVHLLPLGGFVKLAGMEPGQEDIKDGFQAQPVRTRALVVAAGPLMSFLLAVIAMIFVGVYWGFPNLNLPENRVGQVYPKTEAQRIGLRAGDRIIRIDNLVIRRGRDMTDYIHDRPGRKLRLVIQRDGRRLVKEATPQWVVTYLGATWSFMLAERAQVESVQDGSEAKRRGIQVEDILLSLNGRPVYGGRAMVEAINEAGPRATNLVLIREGRRLSLTVKPDIQWITFAGVKWSFPGAFVEAGTDGHSIDPTSPAGRAGLEPGDRLLNVAGIRVTSGEQLLKLLDTKAAEGRRIRLIVSKAETSDRVSLWVSPQELRSIRSGYCDAVGLLGFMPAPTLEKAGFGESILRGLKEFWGRTVYLARVLTSKRVAQDVGGPVMIAKVTASSVRLGAYYVVDMAAMLSLSLAFINLVPIPVLDGGLLVMLLVEAIRRKRLSPEQVQAFTLAGFTTIIILIVLVVYLDVFRIIQGLVPQ
ncbi:MAG: site-2 protease family protein [Armatimonadota bacterium]|nr:site-2 protease family protein [Armatimonadota bacterium]